MEHSPLSPILRWNLRMNRLPEKILLSIAVLALSLLGIWLLKYVWPLLFSLVFSALLEPFVRFFENRRRGLRMPRRLGALLGMLLLFLVAGVLLTVLVQWILLRLAQLTGFIPGFAAWMNQTALPLVKGWYEKLRLLISPYLSSAIAAGFTQLTQSLVRWAGNVSAVLTSGAFATVRSLPDALFSLLLAVMGTYYLSADRPRLSRWIRRTLPPGLQNRLQFFGKRLRFGLFGQLKGQLLLSLLTAGLLAAAFALFRIPNGFSLGFWIGIADMLPVIGAGLFLLPWSIISFLLGQTGQGIFLAACYLGLSLVRQILEPRIIGKKLGLYPLMTMAVMYAGYRAMGFAGLLLGPVLLNVLKAALDADGFKKGDQLKS